MVAGAAVASSVTITNGREDSSNVWLQAAFFSDTTLSAQGTTWHGTYVHTCDARKHGDLKANASVRWGRVCREGGRMVVVVVGVAVCVWGGGKGFRSATSAREDVLSVLCARVCQSLDMYA
jgi:hypothetical protein